MGASSSTRRFLKRTKSSFDISRQNQSPQGESSHRGRSFRRERSDSSSSTSWRHRIFSRERGFATSSGNTGGGSRPREEPSSAIFDTPEFKWIKGRRFHDFHTKEEGDTGIAYFMPNDDEEQDRLQAQHYLIKVSFGGNILCPVNDILSNGGSVLDIGCAQGLWVLECASEFPNATFEGIDITPIFPTLIKPPNAKFSLGNVLEGLTFPTNSFDLTSMRFLVFGFREKEWPKILREIVRVTKPGGWIQLLEPDFFVWRAGPSTGEAIEKINESARMRGQNTHIARKLDVLLEAQGCTDISRRLVSLPINWPEDFIMGNMAHSDLIELLRATKALIISTLGIKEDYWDKLISKIGPECREMNSYMNMHLVIGRKIGFEGAAIGE